MIKEKYGDATEEKSSFKKKKKREMREKLNDTTNWNTLFLNPNTILERMAKKLHITKSEILLADNLAPKIALAEAEVIQETKDWMTKEGNLNLDFLEKDRNLCERSQKTLLIKNLNYRTQQTELKELLEFYGVLTKLLIAPNRAIAIAEFQSAEFAVNVMQNLQNHKFKNNFIYLEYAPLGMVTEEELAVRI
jgi:multiple RNA-binding domain-containing protein 1